MAYHPQTTFTVQIATLTSGASISVGQGGHVLPIFMKGDMVMSPDILEVMSFRMLTRVTATVVCCILMHILCVVSQKKLQLQLLGDFVPQTPYRGSTPGPHFFYVPPIILWDRRPCLRHFDKSICRPKHAYCVTFSTNKLLGLFSQYRYFCIKYFLVNTVTYNYLVPVVTVLTAAVFIWHRSTVTIIVSSVTDLTVPPTAQLGNL